MLNYAVKRIDESAEPLLQKSGAFADSVGRITATGLVVVGGRLSSRVRFVEEELPDQVPAKLRLIRRGSLPMSPAAQGLLGPLPASRRSSGFSSRNL